MEGCRHCACIGSIYKVSRIDPDHQFNNEHYTTFYIIDDTESG